MHSALQHDLFLVKEHTGIFKAANNFDIFDPSSGIEIMRCREDRLGLFTRILRFTDYKRMTPFDIEVRAHDDSRVLSVKRGVSFFLSKVEVYDEHDQHVGGFQQKFFSIGGRFDVLDTQGQVLCSLKGKWTGWDFRFMQEDVELAHVSKKWAGIGKEFFTSADNYVLGIQPSVAKDDPVRILILAAVLCIDMVLKE